MVVHRGFWGQRILERAGGASAYQLTSLCRRPTLYVFLSGWRSNPCHTLAIEAASPPGSIFRNSSGPMNCRGQGLRTTMPRYWSSQSSTSSIKFIAWNRMAGLYSTLRLCSGAAPSMRNIGFCEVSVG